MIELTNNMEKMGYMNTLKNYLLLLRVSHWTKSAFVLLGCIYSQLPGYVLPAVLATLSFCLISSAVYIYNDIEDRSEDSLHPYKRLRPLASDRVTVSEAIVMLFVLLLSGLIIGWLVSRQLAVILTLYLVINVAYNHVLKFIPIGDVVCIAAGYMLRVFAGTIGIGLPISCWLFVAASLLSLFIALNKRRLEMQLGLKHATREVLKKYHPELLHWSIVGTGCLCFITYLLYVIFPHYESFYFILTLPFAAFALRRFAWLATQDVDNDDPVNVFLSDTLSRINLWCFLILTFMALTQG